MITIFSEIKEAHNTAMPSVAEENEVYVRLQDDSNARIREKIKQDLLAIREIDWNINDQSVKETLAHKK